MTTIIARKNPNGTVDLGYDSLVTGGAGGYCEKVWDVNGQMFVGVAGYGRYGDIIQYAPVPRVHEAEFESPDFNIHRYIVMDVIPAWQDALKKAYAPDPETNEDWRKGSILVVVKDEIYTFDSIFGFSAHSEFAGIGSGSEFAIGAMAAGKSVDKALEIAADLDTGTGGDLKVIKGLK